MTNDLKGGNEIREFTDPNPKNTRPAPAKNTIFEFDRFSIINKDDRVMKDTRMQKEQDFRDILHNISEDEYSLIIEYRKTIAKRQKLAANFRKVGFEACPKCEEPDALVLAEPRSLHYDLIVNARCSICNAEFVGSFKSDQLVQRK